MKILFAGLAGGMAMNLAMLLTFRGLGFGWNGDGVLLRSPIQSPKLIAVWTQLEPLPLVVANPLPIAVGILGFGFCHACIYNWLSVAWPPGLIQRALRLAGLVFLMTFAFWEFFTPYNQFGEPLALLALELLFWALIALAEGLAIATIMEWGGKTTRQVPTEDCPIP